MGTDIHGVFQRHDAATGRWVGVASTYEQHRHYQLFAVLAGVRNGSGFAGIRTGEPVRPISEPRGFPADFEVQGEVHQVSTLDHMDPRRAGYRREGPEAYADDPLGVWMGDHSHSWVTGEEMLAWAEHAPTIVQCGVLTRAEYEAWDKKSQPKSYCGDVWGGAVVVIEEPQLVNPPDVWTHVRVTWEQSLRTELSYFFDEVARLVSEHGTVRFVFGFDS